MGLVTGFAAVSIGITLATTFPLAIATGAGRFFALRDFCAQPVEAIWTSPAVDIVLANRAAEIGACVEGDHRVSSCPVALLTARYQFFAGLATKLSRPVIIFALERTVTVLNHMREDIFV